MTIDINCMYGPGLESQPAMFGPLYPRMSAADFVAELDRAGVRRAGIAAPPWLGGAFIDPDYEKANEAIHDAVRENPDRLFGVGRVNPAFGSRGLAVARRCLAEFHFRGLLFDAETDRFVPSDLEGLSPYVSLCRSHGASLLLMTGIHPLQPLIFLPLARAFPDVPVVLLRMGAFVPDDAVIAARLADNIYLETSTQTPRETGRAIATIGPERVLFGSGFPYAAIAAERDKIAGLPGLDEAARNAVLGGNAARLFG